MTLLKPTLVVTRLVVTRRGYKAIDLSFHEGLNVLRGENSAGKTTVIRFLAHGLGAESIEFNQVAQLCEETFVELRANDVQVTLRRAVNQGGQQPLSIFWGPSEQAIAAGPEGGWQIFPFRRSSSKESFSQVLFRLLELPELRGESGSNITMHQLLRLIYSDQETPPGEIFRLERFDSGITRAAIGDYLLGIDNNELYDLRLRSGALEKSLAEVKAAMRSIFSTLGASGTEISLEFIDDRVNTLGSELNHLNTQLENLRNNTNKGKTSATGEDNRLRAELADSHSKLSNLKNRKLDIETRLADAELFLAELEERLASIDESQTVASTLGTAIFSFCPSCYSKVESPIGSKALCVLCKSPISLDSAKTQLLRMKNELALQLRESRLIKEQQLDELQDISRQIPSLQSKVESLESEYHKNSAQWRSPLEIEIQQISRQIGAREQEIKNTLELKKLAHLLSEHEGKAAKLESELTWTRGRMEAVQREQQGRRQEAYLAVAEKLKHLLKEDLERQAEFRIANEIGIDFGANRVSVDGQTQFSASSMVYLRHSFHLALLLAAAETPFFRFPRIIILDGIEDGGMETDRSFNFQELIRHVSDALPTSHQIILATSRIAPNLNNPKYVVGAEFTHDQKSIQMK